MPLHSYAHLQIVETYTDHGVSDTKARPLHSTK
jgi:hypothetical protein